MGSFHNRSKVLQGGGAISRVWVLAIGIVVVNLGGLPAVVPLVILGDIEAAASLLRFERLDQLLRLGHAAILRMEGHEIGEGGNGLGGDALVVFGGFGLFVVGHTGPVKPVNASRLVVIAVSGFFVGLGGGRIIFNQSFFLRQTNVQLRLRSNVAIGAVF